MDNETPVTLKIPRQDLESFSLFALNSGAAKKWVEGLPVTNTKLVVQLLHQAISDLNRVELGPETRYEILETLRSTVYVALSNLSRGFLNQPLIMPEEPRRLAIMADNLHGLICSGYTIAAFHAIQQRESVNKMSAARLVCEATYRALASAGQQILQRFQLYQPVPPEAWENLHQLYALAERQQLAKHPVVDNLFGGGSVTACYLQTVLLDCCKPNQLRQTDLAAIFHGLHSWSKLVTLEEQQLPSDLFLVDLNSDQAAVYANAPPLSMHAECRFINTKELVEHLNQLREQGKRESRSGVNFGRDVNIPANILDHLIASLGSVNKRHFSRADSSATMWMAVGLSSTHFHVANGRVFEQVLFGDDVVPERPASAKNPFIPKTDVDKAERPSGHQRAGDDVNLRERYPIFPVRMVNASPGGYCVEWSKDLPRDIKTGNIACVREPSGDAWVIAVIRWISQLEQAKTLIGIELLSPRAEPYGASVHKTTGAAAEPMRALLLPEIQLVGQPQTLITPRAGFKEQHKVSLTCDGEEVLVQLQKQVMVTGDFSQFNFRFIKQLEEVFAEDKSGPLDSAYDSIWSNI